MCDIRIRRPLSRQLEWRRWEVSSFALVRGGSSVSHNVTHGARYFYAFYYFDECQVVRRAETNMELLHGKSEQWLMSWALSSDTHSLTKTLQRIPLLGLTMEGGGRVLYIHVCSTIRDRPSYVMSKQSNWLYLTVHHKHLQPHYWNIFHCI